MDLMGTLLLCDNRQHMPICAKMSCSLVRKVLSVATHVSQYPQRCCYVWGFVGGVSLVSILQAGDWARVSTPVRHYCSTSISTMDWHQDSMQHAVLGVTK